MDTQNKIGFGCVGLSAQPFETSALKLLQVAFDEGITHFDTAPLYGKGYSEKILGKFLKGRRQQVTVTTKFGLSARDEKNIPVWLALPLNNIKKSIKKQAIKKTQFQEPGLLSYRKIELAAIRNDLEKSLRNLNTDHIDNYLLHEGMPSFLTDEALNYILDLKKKGVVRKIGIASSYTNFITKEKDTFNEWDVLQYENSILHPSEKLLDLFPHKEHFYHSVLKPLKYKKITNDLINEIPGILLARSSKINPMGKILFSSSRHKNIKVNLKNFNTYSQYSLDELNDLLSNAIH